MKKNIFIVLLLVTANMLCAEDTAYFGYPDYGFPQSQRAMWYNNMPFHTHIRTINFSGMMYPAGNIDTLYGFALSMNR